MNAVGVNYVFVPRVQLALVLIIHEQRLTEVSKVQYAVSSV